jgi:hypothetical protein
LVQEYTESSDQWEAFAVSLRPITAIFGKTDGSLGQRLNTVIVTLAAAQAELLLFGRIKGQNSPNLKKLSGMPYLSGDDTWIDFPRLFSIPLLQPDKVHFRENKDADWVHVLPLLREMESVFTVLANEISAILKEAERELIISEIKRERVKNRNKFNKIKVNNDDKIRKNDKENKNNNKDKTKKQNKNINNFKVANLHDGTLSAEINRNGDFGVLSSIRNVFRGGERDRDRVRAERVRTEDTTSSTTSTSPSPERSSLSASSSLYHPPDTHSPFPTPTTTLSPSSFSSPSLSLYPSLKIVSDDYLVLNEAAVDILRELDDCTALLVLRVSHVCLLYESRDKVVTRTKKTQLQRDARALLGVAKRVR